MLSRPPSFTLLVMDPLESNPDSVELDVNAETSGVQPMLLTIPEAARMIGLGRSKTYELVTRGELRVVRIGRAVRLPRTAVENWVAEQVAAATGDDPNAA